MFGVIVWGEGNMLLYVVLPAELAARANPYSQAINPQNERFMMEMLTNP